MGIRLERPPITKKELHALVHAMWGVYLPTERVCEGHTAPFDAFAEGYFGNTSNYTLWYGSRGSGKSYMLALLALTKAAVLDIDVTLLGGSMAQSQNVHEHVESLLKAPNAPLYAINRVITTEVEFVAGNWIRPLPASQKTVRGPHPQMTLLDEIDEMDRSIYDAALPQAMQKPNARGHLVREMIVASSTWQKPIGTFSEIYNEALLKGLPVHTWCVASGTLITTSRGQVPIQEVTDSDLVLTRQGFRHVQHVTFMGYKPTVMLDFGDVTLRTTDDHLIATPDGWPDGWRHASALAADAMSPARSNPSVLRCELMPFPQWLALR